ncbi:MULTISPECIES: hypothetical protein [unclassified Microcoleus]|uniref:hypothetical protein n=1 Tax=unclassified Microcoleus TaxID=2642155 RepID=UPI002FD4D6F8
MNLTTNIFPENQCQDLTFGDRLVQPLRQWLDSIAVGEPQVTQWCANLYSHGVLLREICSYGDTIFSTYRLSAS